VSGKFKSGVTVPRRDLYELVAELTFEELGLVGEEISPIIKVSEKSSTYPVLPREEIGKIADIKRGPGGTFSRGKWEYDTASYTTSHTGTEEEVELVNAIENDEMFLDDEEVAAQRVAQKLKLGNESTVAAALFNETTFAGTSISNPSSTYFTSATTHLVDIINEMDDATNASPYNVIDIAYKSILRPRTLLAKNQFSLIISDDNFDSMLRTTEVLSSSQYVEPVALMQRERQKAFLTQFLGVKEIKIVRSMYDITGLGVDPAEFGKFWSNEYMMLAKLSSGINSWKEQAVSRQPLWKKYTNGLFLITDYAEPQTMKVVYQGTQYRGITVNTDYGLLFKNVKSVVSSTTGI